MSLSRTEQETMLCIAVPSFIPRILRVQNVATFQKKKGHNDDQALVVKSWLGSVKDEKGGASLKFESPLDDVSSVDTRWLRRLVLRVLEMLYYENKWERLVDLALRFNALSE